MDLNSFSFRAGLLLTLMLGISLWDLYQNGAHATRFREYGYILIAGAIGAAFGCINDLVTSTISPDFFILGKGLEAGPNFRLDAGLYGARAGFAAGIIGGALSLFTARKKSGQPPLTYFGLLRMLWMPVAGAMVFGLLVPLGFSGVDPLHFSSQLNGLVDETKIDRFRQVWWIHVGLYAGLIAGLVAMVVCAIRARAQAGLQTTMSE